MIEEVISKAIANEVARLVRDLAPTGHPDDLIELPGPLQRRTAMALVKSGKLKAKKIGQHWYTLRRHLAALVDGESTETEAFDADAFARSHLRRRSA